MQYIPNEYPDNALLYGAVLGGTSSGGYTVEFDILPFNCCTIQKVKRSCIHVLLEDRADEPLNCAKTIAALEEAARLNFSQRVYSVSSQKNSEPTPKPFNASITKTTPPSSRLLYIFNFSVNNIVHPFFRVFRQHKL